MHVQYDPLADIDRPTVDDPWRPGDGLMSTRRCAVYRFHHPTGALLYVGVADEPERRFREHAENSATWWWQWCWHTVAWYPDRPYALGVEAHAIVAEHPAYNIRGRSEPGFPGEPWTGDERLVDDSVLAHPSRAELDRLFGVARRTAALDRKQARLELPADVANERYTTACANASRLIYRLHRLRADAFHKRERAGERLLAARLTRADQLDDERRRRADVERESRLREEARVASGSESADG